MKLFGKPDYVRVVPDVGGGYRSTLPGVAVGLQLAVWTVRIDVTRQTRVPRTFLDALLLWTGRGVT